MGENYRVRTGTFREVVKQTTEIQEIKIPLIELDKFYGINYSTEFIGRERIRVQGGNGELDISISTEPFSLLDRVKQAYNLIVGKNISVRGGGPKEEEIRNNPVVKQYLADSRAFNKALEEKKNQKHTEVLSDRTFQVTSQGVNELSLEKKLSE